MLIQERNGRICTTSIAQRCWPYRRWSFARALLGLVLLIGACALGVGTQRVCLAGGAMVLGLLSIGGALSASQISEVDADER
jgi:hypothetical protein